VFLICLASSERRGFPNRGECADTTATVAILVSMDNSQKHIPEGILPRTATCQLGMREAASRSIKRTASTLFAAECSDGYSASRASVPRLLRYDERRDAKVC
jgi:hypothetical protein